MPLIISGPEPRIAPSSTLPADSLIAQLAAGDVDVDEKQRTTPLTEQGNEHVEKLLGQAGLLTEGEPL